MVNIFRLHDDPERAARAHCDQHVLSGIHETGLVLATALREHADWDDATFFERTAADPAEHQFYGSSHVGHPLNEWVTKRGNFAWAYDYLDALYREKQYRYGGGHATWEDYARFLPRKPTCFEPGTTPQYQAIPPALDCSDPVVAYRAYYIWKELSDEGGDRFWMSWAHDREPPDWFVIRAPTYGIETDITPANVPDMDYEHRPATTRPLLNR